MKKLITFLFVIVCLNAVAQNPIEKFKENYHQFDFWIGYWDVYKFGTDTLVGKSTIESIIDSIAILENYSAVKSKYKGKSLNKFNPAKNRWEQYWIDNSGLTLFLSGKLINKKMVLEDTEYGNIKIGLNRIVWEKLTKNSIRQTWSISKDNGKTWLIVFDGKYIKRNL